MFKVNFQSKVNLKSFHPTADSLQWEVELNVIDLEGVFSVNDVIADDVVILDTSALQPGTISLYKIIEIVNKDMTSITAIVQYLEQTVNEIQPDLSYLIGLDGMITRPTVNGFLPVSSPAIQQLSDRFSFYVQNYNLKTTVNHKELDEVTLTPQQIENITRNIESNIFSRLKLPTPPTLNVVGVMEDRILLEIVDNFNINNYRFNVNGVDLPNEVLEKQFTLSELSSNTKYAIAVKSISDLYDTDFSTVIEQYTGPAPLEINILEVADTFVRLGLLDVSQVDSFKWYLDGNLIEETNTSEYTFNNLNQTTLYQFGVVGVNNTTGLATGLSIKNITTDETFVEPIIPEDIVLTVDNVGENEVTLSWVDKSVESEPTNIFLNSDVFRSGIVGPINEDSDPNSILLASGGRSAWIGKITANEATFKVIGNNQPSHDANRVEVSINNGEFYKPEVVGIGEYKIQNLNNAQVHLKIGGAYGNASGFSKLEPCLSVVGSDPLVSIPNWFNAHEDLNWKTSAFSNNIFNTYSSFSRKAVYNGGNTFGGAAPSICFRAQDVTELKIFTPVNKVSVWVNGQVFYAEGSRSSNIDGQVITVTNLPLGEHQFLIVTDSGSTLGAGFAVSHNGLELPNQVTSRLDQYGDSITDGRVNDGKDKVDIFEVASALGFVASNPGVSGETISGLLERLDVILPLKETDITKDIAVLAIGRNDTAIEWDQTKKNNYLAIINKLLTKYKGVICRGILPEGSNTWTSQNTDISQIVSDLNISNVVFVDTSGWLEIETVDGTHPNIQGYRTIASYAIPAYTNAISTMG